MPTFDDLASFYPGWVALLIGVVLAFNKLAEESEKFAKTFGRLGREIRRRALLRHQIDLKAAEFALAVQAAVQEAVTRAREEWEQDENEAIAALDARLSTVSKVTAQQLVDLEEMRFHVNCMSAYSDYETVWHNTLMVRVIEKGGVFSLADIPHHIGYYEWEKAFRVNINWRKWAFDDDGTGSPRPAEK